MVLSRTMATISLTLGLLLSLTAAKDPRVCALRGRDYDQLVEICQKASVTVPEGADAEALRVILFEFMQNEIPESVRPKGTPLLPWPGPGQPGECDNAAVRPPKAGGDSAAALNTVAAALFGKLDVNRDDQLSPSEMQAMIDEVNAAARAKGEAEHDLFKTLDRNMDGMVSRSEAEESFKQIAASQMKAGAAASTTASGAAKGGSGGEKKADTDKMAEDIFKALDLDKDERLSKTEFQSVLSQYEAEAKAKGEEQSDFWTDLDANKDDHIDMSEAKHFFAMMASALKTSKKDEL